jgi:hypothetical protein
MHLNVAERPAALAYFHGSCREFCMMPTKVEDKLLLFRITCRSVCCLASISY